MVDTGATISTIAESLAKQLGIKETLGRGTMRTLSGTIPAWGGVVEMCLGDPGCGCSKAPVAVLPDDTKFSRSEALIGQDVLEMMQVTIDCAHRSLKCGRGKA